MQKLKSKNFLLAVVIITALLLPFIVADFTLILVIRILYMTILAYSLSFLAGQGGMISLGQTVFFGLSAYTLAILSIEHGMNFPYPVIYGLFAAVLFAVIVGPLVIKTEAVYFIMITLALGQMAWGLALQWSSLTHGDDGIIGVRPPAIFGISFRENISFYYLLFFIFIIIVYLLHKIINSKFGLALKAVKNNPEKLSSLGYNVLMIKYIAFIISSLLAGIAGVFFVYFNGVINPASIGIDQAVWVLVVVILGGVNYLIGPLIGAALVIFLEIGVSQYTDRYMMIIGLVFVLTILFLPEGIFDFIKKKINLLSQQN